MSQGERRCPGSGRLGGSEGLQAPHTHMSLGVSEQKLGQARTPQKRPGVGGTPVPACPHWPHWFHLSPPVPICPHWPHLASPGFTHPALPLPALTCPHLAALMRGASGAPCRHQRLCRNPPGGLTCLLRQATGVGFILSAWLPQLAANRGQALPEVPRRSRPP